MNSVRWWPTLCGESVSHRWPPTPAYDSEPNHKFARDQHHIRTVIPPKHGRPTTKSATGRYRRLMQVRFDRLIYRQRAQIETVMSMIKRRQGAHVCGRSFWSQCRDLRLLALTHNVLLLVLGWVFYRAAASPFSPYVVRTGCQWRMLPRDFPNWSTVYGVFWRWRDDGTWQRTEPGDIYEM